MVGPFLWGVRLKREWFDSNSLLEASSSNGRAADSKSACWGFESLLAC